MVRIKQVTENRILFTNGDTITYDHIQDCCEHNYADFEQIDDIAYQFEFEEPIIFEPVYGAGFRFGNPYKMIFVPCYSDQNGFYSNEVDIFYKGHLVLTIDAQGA